MFFPNAAAQNGIAVPSLFNAFQLPTAYTGLQVNVRDSSWLKLQVCELYLTQKCPNVDNCSLAHPPNTVKIENNTVTVCYDYIKKKDCKHGNCKYYHPHDALSNAILRRGDDSKKNGMINNLSIPLAVRNSLYLQRTQHLLSSQFSTDQLKTKLETMRQASSNNNNNPGMILNPMITNGLANQNAWYSAISGVNTQPVQIPTNQQIATAKLPNGSDAKKVKQESSSIVMTNTPVTSTTHLSITNPYTQPSLQHMALTNPSIANSMLQPFYCTNQPNPYDFNQLLLNQQKLYSPLLSNNTLPVNYLTQPTVLSPTLLNPNVATANHNVNPYLTSNLISPFYYQQLLQNQTNLIPQTASTSAGLSTAYPAPVNLVELQRRVIEETSVAFINDKGAILETLPVCKDFLSGKCKRSQSCNYVHLLDNYVEVKDCKLTVCKNALKGQCNRQVCKFYHIPSYQLQKLGIHPNAQIPSQTESN